MHSSTFHSIPAGSGVHVVPANLSLARGAKRLKDIVGAGVGLAIFAIPMLVIAALIRRDGGPALYGHKRVGRNGVMFSCLKFRTMVMNGDDLLAQYLATHEAARAEWEADRKLKNDPRVTRMGEFLRKTSLDELPQLINVLKGEMSLVGPRPIVTDELVKYGARAKYYLSTTPGVTGLWQVSGRNTTTYEERVALDTQYVRQWSFWRDLSILWLTIPALVSRNGAY